MGTSARHLGPPQTSMSLEIILLCICAILLGAFPAPKPVGWVVVGLAVIALLTHLTGLRLG